MQAGMDACPGLPAVSDLFSPAQQDASSPPACALKKLPTAGKSRPPLALQLTNVVTAPGEAPAAEEEETAEPVMVEWPYGALDTVEASTFYLDVARAGIQYGPHFKMVHKRHIEGKQVVLRWGEPASPCCWWQNTRSDECTSERWGSLAASAIDEREGHVQPFTEHLKYPGWRRWDNCFIRLLDGMLQAGALGSTDYQLRIPTKIRQIEILDAKPRLPSGSESEPIATQHLLPCCHMRWRWLSIICTSQLAAALVADI